MMEILHMNAYNELTVDIQPAGNRTLRVARLLVTRGFAVTALRSSNDDEDAT